MKKHLIKTTIGSIAVFERKIYNNITPVIFLHGVYFDHHLWQHQIVQIHDRTVYAIDMPWHGESTAQIASRWNLDDCANMLLEMLDSLQIEKVIAIGHSWGSMTILRAASKQPQRFASIGLSNIPFEAASGGKKLSFALQHSMLAFKKFYIKQAGKSLFGKQSLVTNPALQQILFASMHKLTSTQIKRVDKFVILKATNTASLIEKLTVPALALKGNEDYVPTPPTIETTIVSGGHISPLEAISEVNMFCKKVIELEKR